MKLIRLTSAALFLFCLTSCGGPERRIVGKWKTNDGASETNWEFFENGTLSKDGAPGRYSFGDNQRIKIQTPAATFVYQFEMQKDAMTWTAWDGAKTKLTRVK